MIFRVSPSALSTAQINQLLGGFRFSVNSTLVVPGVGGTLNSPKVLIAPYAQQVSQHVRCMRLFQALPEDERFQGKSFVCDEGLKGGHDSMTEMAKGDRKDFTSMKLGEGNEHEASLLFDSQRHGFSLVQSAAVQIGYRGRATRRQGIAGIEITLSSARLLREVAQTWGGHGFPSGKDIINSLDSNGNPTPFTAFCLASRIDQEVIRSHKNDRLLYKAWHLSSDTDGVAYKGNKAISPEGIGLSPEVTLKFSDNWHMFCRDYNVVRSPSELGRDFYVGYKARSEQGTRTVSAPKVNIIQKTAFTKWGTEPFAESIIDIMLAAAKLCSGTFPLRPYKLG